MTTIAMPPATDGAESEAAGEKGGKKKLVLILVVLLLVAGAAYWFLLRPTPAEAEEPPPEPGEVLAMDAIQLNLAGGHYLRVGLALQFTLEAAGHGEPDGSKALDAAIKTFSNLPLEEVQQPKQREELRHHLLEEIDHAYHGEVMEVYFTEFVTQ